GHGDQVPDHLVDNNLPRILLRKYLLGDSRHPAGKKEERNQGQDIEGERQPGQHEVEGDRRQGPDGPGSERAVAGPPPGGHKDDEASHRPAVSRSISRYTSRRGSPFSAAIRRHSSNS